jgi:hypothetical protein
LRIPRQCLGEKLPQVTETGMIFMMRIDPERGTALFSAI